MSRYVKIPGFEEIKITEAGLHWLRQAHDFDQGARSDANGRRERVYHPGPAAGHSCAALVDKGLLRYAHASSDVDMLHIGVEATAAGCFVLAAAKRHS